MKILSRAKAIKLIKEDNKLIKFNHQWNIDDKCIDAVILEANEKAEYEKGI